MPTMKRVYPISQEIADHLRHPSVPAALSMVTGGNWPNDQFTMRRLQEGSITDKKHSTEPQAAGVEPQPQVSDLPPSPPSGGGHGQQRRRTR